MVIPFWVNFIATGFFVGKIPFMPGTFGSLVAVPFVIAMSPLHIAIKLAITLSVFILGIIVSNIYTSITKLDDPSCIVIDEIVGVFLIFSIFPAKVSYLIAGFILFRIFDILKPFPVSFFDNIKNGFGIMADDIVASCYAIISLFILEWLLARFFGIIL